MILSTDLRTVPEVAMSFIDSSCIRVAFWPNSAWWPDPGEETKLSMSLLDFLYSSLR